MEEPIKEVAKAAAEIARMGGKAIDSANKLGGFFSRIFGPALEEFGLSLQDRVKYWRIKNLVRLNEKWETLRLRSNTTSEPKPLPPKFAFSLIENASMEDDDYLHDMFASLLYNTTTDSNATEPRQAYLEIIKGMSSFDAKILASLHNAPDYSKESSGEKLIYTEKIPHEYVQKTDDTTIINPPHEVIIALNNLHRLGCVVPTSLWGGGVSFGLVSLSSLGRAFVEACTAKQEGTI